MGKEIVIDVRGLYFGYLKEPILQNLYFQARQGERIAIVGANGSGKTTFLKLLLGHLKPWEGEIKILDREIASTQDRVFSRKHIAYVPQERIVGKMPISVYDAVLLGRYAVGFAGIKKPTQKDRELALEAIEAVGLKDFVRADVSTLSGGQLQRMSIARGLVRKAPIMFLDEPIAHLDKLGKEDIPLLLENIHLEKQFCMIVITHENISMDFDRVFHLEAGLLKEI
ncbi:MAG: metal ABC transporter ATP-binding protein [Bacillota bacterium]|jgi:ABC-type Mn2+/Zn2+ transport system ATPase subunit|nr:ATP-binding cassette domain-containing protein [Bacillota bacterium]NLU55725.1 ATP-binding cassette domain-containing protein [Bacillota bacterium]HOA91219.1 ATP-binding cassette domain-containing protein [Bacillota bacterium]HOJ46548.1 ATP-binding cassette domain-containing protein [Bacillota bacterium]HOL13968.1 ATP-binding cassette domain-containing protein [Bacillota bacterium]